MTREAPAVQVLIDHAVRNAVLWRVHAAVEAGHATLAALDAFAARFLYDTLGDQVEAVGLPSRVDAFFQVRVAAEPLPEAGLPVCDGGTAVPMSPLILAGKDWRASRRQKCPDCRGDATIQGGRCDAAWVAQVSARGARGFRTGVHPLPS